MADENGSGDADAPGDADALSDSTPDGEAADSTAEGPPDDDESADPGDDESADPGEESVASSDDETEADGDGAGTDGEDGRAQFTYPDETDVEMRDALESEVPDSGREPVDSDPGEDGAPDADGTTSGEDDWEDDVVDPEPVESQAAARAAGTGGAANPPDPSTATAVGAGAGSGGGGGVAGGTATAPDDQEMPLTEHIEEMVTRLGVVIVVMALVSGVVFPFADRLINFLWYSFLPGTIEQCPVPPSNVGPNEVACPTLYHPLALMFARLKVASLAGFVVALPVMVYESYLFMRPGLYPRERRYYLASVPTSLVLACVGVLFAYFLVLPVLFQYFTGYTSQAADIAFGLSDTFSLIVMMLGFFALVFQIPLLMMLAIMMGVTSRQWLADKRLYFWGGFATVAFIFSPDPTGMAPILVAVTMVVLFEGTLFLLKWTGN